MKPTIINGVPLCSGDECEEYDGKRCKVLGFQPWRICEPMVCENTTELKELRADGAELAALRARYAALEQAARDVIENENDWSIYNRIDALKAALEGLKNVKP